PLHPQAGELLRLRRRRRPRGALRPGPAVAGEVRELPARRGARRRRRHPRRFADVRPVGQRAPRRHRQALDLHLRGPRPRLLLPRGRLHRRLPVRGAVRPGPGARHPPALRGHRVAGHRPGRQPAGAPALRQGRRRAEPAGGAGQRPAAAHRRGARLPRLVARVSEAAAGARVTAVVVTYEPTTEVTVPLLEELAAQCGAVVVVDNGSAADRRESLQEACARLVAELVELPENRGIAAAQNVGIRRAQGADYVLLMYQDSLPAPDMVARLVAGARGAVAAGRAVGAVGPVSADTRSSTEQMVYVSRTWGPRRATAQELDAERLETAFLLASGCLVPTPVLATVGLMNEAWFIDHVDLEWGLRVRRAGYTLFAVPDAHLAHSLGDRLTKLPGRAQEVHVHSPV